MRFIAWVVALGDLLLASHAHAYPRVPHHGALGAFLSELAIAARASDMHAIRRLTDREFTIGEELGRDDSLRALAHDASMRKWLAATADHGACYRTTSTQVQCELPDPGANLDHTKLRTSIAMLEHTRHGWKLVAFYA